MIPIRGLGVLIDLIGVITIAFPDFSSVSFRNWVYSNVPQIRALHIARNELLAGGEIRRTSVIDSIYPLMAEYYDLAEGIEVDSIQIHNNWLEVESGPRTQRRVNLDRPTEPISNRVDEIIKAKFVKVGIILAIIGTFLLFLPLYWMLVPAAFGAILLSLILHEGAHWYFGWIWTEEITVRRKWGILPAAVKLDNVDAVSDWGIRLFGSSPLIIWGSLLVFLYVEFGLPFNYQQYGLVVKILYLSLVFAAAVISPGDWIAILFPAQFRQIAEDHRSSGHLNKLNILGQGVKRNF